MKYLIWDDQSATLELEVVHKQVFAHAKIKRWSLDDARHTREVLKSIASTLWLGGAREIFALAPDEKVARFAKFYGFECLNQFTDGRVFMKRPIQPPATL